VAMNDEIDRMLESMREEVEKKRQHVEALFHVIDSKAEKAETASIAAHKKEVEVIRLLAETPTNTDLIRILQNEIRELDAFVEVIFRSTDQDLEVFHPAKYNLDYKINEYELAKAEQLSQKLTLQDEIIEFQYFELDQYKAGPTKKSEDSEAKWAKAAIYLLEEIPKHKTLKEARKVAANRAGIFVEERQLAKKLPRPK
jgi:hypothetical protein